MAAQVKTLTRAQLYKACKKHRYLIYTYTWQGRLVRLGANGRVANLLAEKRGMLMDGTETKIISYKPCDLMEYLTYKVPFL